MQPSDGDTESTGKTESGAGKAGADGGAKAKVRVQSNPIQSKAKIFKALSHPNRHAQRQMSKAEIERLAKLAMQDEGLRKLLRAYGPGMTEEQLLEGVIIPLCVAGLLEMREENGEVFFSISHVDNLPEAIEKAWMKPGREAPPGLRLGPLVPQGLRGHRGRAQRVLPPDRIRPPQGLQRQPEREDGVHEGLSQARQPR
jgi:hypothetical protein